jgi:hypothetical protein
MAGSISRRGVLRLTAFAAAGASGATALVAGNSPVGGPAFLLADAPTGADDTLVTVMMTSTGAVAVANSADELVLRSFAAGEDQVHFSAAGDLATFPAEFVPTGMAVSGDLISIYGGEWTSSPGDSFDRGTSAVTVPDVAASATIQQSSSTESVEVRQLRPASYQYSTTSLTLTRVDSPTLNTGTQALFLETVLPGAASIIGLIDDDEDLASMSVVLALWGLDGTLLIGATIGVASAIKDIVIPIGAGSLFSFVETSDIGGNTVTPTLLGLVPLPLASHGGTLVASARTATSSVALVEDDTGNLFRWAPLTGWATITQPPLGAEEYFTGVAGGSPDPLFAAATGAGSFRLVSI